MRTQENPPAVEQALSPFPHSDAEKDECGCVRTDDGECGCLSDRIKRRRSAGPVS